MSSLLIIMILLSLPAFPAFAAVHSQSPSWQNIFLNNNQKAMNYFKQQDYQHAAKTFSDPRWQGLAYYRAENYEQAAAVWSTQNSAEDQYNYGNALAKLRRYPEAIKAYEQALHLQPHHADAKYNKELLEKLLAKQHSNEQQKSNDNQQNFAVSVKLQKKKSTPNPAEQQPSMTSSQPSEKAPPLPDQTMTGTNKLQQRSQQQPLQPHDEQQLQNIPDTINGYLQNKFLRDYQRRLDHDS